VEVNVEREASDIGKLTISLRLGESARVRTPDGDVVVKCVRALGTKGVSLQIAAPRDFAIDRERTETAG
jgi:hypothetical protein